ncbi:unnamed protein product [Symbiodinium sp. KB8]|nr:unnamed protein product [Symbiodinium sp. KB8]
MVTSTLYVSKGGKIDRDTFAFTAHILAKITKAQKAMATGSPLWVVSACTCGLRPVSEARHGPRRQTKWNLLRGCAQGCSRPSSYKSINAALPLYSAPLLAGKQPRLSGDSPKVGQGVDCTDQDRGRLFLFALAVPGLPVTLGKQALMVQRFGKTTLRNRIGFQDGDMPASGFC